MTAIPECMTRRPTDDESRAAARRLLDAGAYDPEADMPVRLRRRPDGGAYIITEPGGLAGLAIVTSAALLDATERAERAEAALAALRMTTERDSGALAALYGHVSAGHVLCTDCDGHGEWSIEADDGREMLCSCGTCDGTGWYDAVTEVAALRRVVEAADALASGFGGHGRVVTADAVERYRLARAEVKP